MSNFNQIGAEATEIFNAYFADALLSFNEVEVANAIASWLRTEGIKLVESNEDPEGLEIILEMGLAALLNRGAIGPVRPYSAAGKAQIETLLARYRVVPASQRPAAVDPMDQLVVDYKTQRTDVFNARLRNDPAFNDLFNAAVEVGRI